MSEMERVMRAFEEEKEEKERRRKGKESVGQTTKKKLSREEEVMVVARGKGLGLDVAQHMRVDGRRLLSPSVELMAGVSNRFAGLVGGMRASPLSWGYSSLCRCVFDEARGRVGRMLFMWFVGDGVGDVRVLEKEPVTVMVSRAGKELIVLPASRVDLEKELVGLYLDVGGGTGESVLCKEGDSDVFVVVDARKELCSELEKWMARSRVDMVSRCRTIALGSRGAARRNNALRHVDLDRVFGGACRGGAQTRVFRVCQRDANPRSRRSGYVLLKPVCRSES